MTAHERRRGESPEHGRLPTGLRIRGLTKNFPGVTALDDVGLDVHAGQILALVGQNGSGKSTLVKVLAGLYEPDPGSEIVVDVDGASRTIDHARDRIHFIHQDLGLISTLSTVENLALGRRWSAAHLRPSRPRAQREAAEALLGQFGVHFDVCVPVADLSAAERAIVAIARALNDCSGTSNILVLDEPTAALGGKEVNKLFHAIRRLADAGNSVIFISHHLSEVMELADRVVALRDGQVVADRQTADIDYAELVAMIVGKTRSSEQSEAAGDDEVGVDSGSPALEVSALSSGALRELTLKVDHGEIVGISGVLGSGREHVCSALFGARSQDGSIEIAGLPLRPSPRTAIKQRLLFVPADRRRQGAVMTMTARENLTLPMMASRLGWIAPLRVRREKGEAADWARKIALKPMATDRPLHLFSGGNQQKVVLARWLRMQPTVLLLDEPTQGVDIGGQASIYALIRQAASDGAAVIVSSADARELAELCDRVLVLRNGRVARELSGPELTEGELIRESLNLTRADSEELFGPVADLRSTPGVSSEKRAELASPSQGKARP
jgi:ABC-type sugar transport system ATPase subunit